VSERIASAATKLPGFVKRAQHALARAEYRMLLAAETALPWPFWLAIVVPVFATLGFFILRFWRPPEDRDR
jgi:hypothetical protein